MFGYATAYIIVFICLLISLFRDKKLNQAAFYILAVVLVCLCGFRHISFISGNDTYEYFQRFLLASKEKVMFWDERFLDPGFLILTKVIRFFSDNGYLYNFIIALLTIIPVLYLYKKVSSLPVVAVFLYVCFQVGGSSPYFMAFNQMRQTLAVGIMCIAMYYYIKNNYQLNIKIVVILILNLFMHWSSILVLLPFLLKPIKLGRFFYIIVMITAAIAGLFAQRFVPQLIDMFLFLEQGYYIDEGIEFSLIHNLPLLLLSCYVFFISSKEECNSFEHKCLFLQFVMFGFFAPFNGGIFRFCVYYGVIGNLAIVSSFYKSFKRKNALSIGVAFVSFLYISYVILVSLAGLEKGYPYSMF